MEYKDILYEREGGIATITLNRPETLNATTPRMQEEIAHALGVAAEDASVRVVILTGMGRAFCAGANPRTLAERQSSGAFPPTVHRVAKALWQFPKPVIGAINGPAVGGGMDLASLCDIRLASDRARFGMAYVRMGTIPAEGGLWLLPRHIGLSNALDLIWTGRLIDAQEAFRLGYVQAVFVHQEFPQRVREYAQRLATGPTVAINTAKVLAYRFLAVTDFTEALHQTAEAAAVVNATEDAKEGPRAWLERREPRFQGR
ncbi:MAG: enoyl-CoA hydratase/isomerase family protein [Dehalococcoidia bacterium]|nr:enoyl-CoA hydratase/isomerase family protein [Dehalococcoidia bacterium]MDW8119220.1 enoyl-CoA hydratase/isomerase family protein [Chloroflexota bacterium]